MLETLFSPLDELLSQPRREAWKTGSEDSADECLVLFLQLVAEGLGLRHGGGRC